MVGVDNNNYCRLALLRGRFFLHDGRRQLGRGDGSKLSGGVITALRRTPAIRPEKTGFKLQK